MGSPQELQSQSGATLAHKLLQTPRFHVSDLCTLRSEAVANLYASHAEPGANSNFPKHQDCTQRRQRDQGTSEVRRGTRLRLCQCRHSKDAFKPASRRFKKLFFTSPADIELVSVFNLTRKNNCILSSCCTSATSPLITTQEVPRVRARLHNRSS